MSNGKVVKILLDADVLIHFVKGGRPAMLTTLFPQRLVLLDRVHEELNRQNDVGTVVTNFLTFKFLEIVNFPTKDLNVVREYAQLIKSKGKGESACLAFCRHHPHIIASSNLRDISAYCSEHQLAYLTTMDILCIALLRGEMSEKECDDFITDVRKAGSKLPPATISQYREKHFDHLKSQY